MSAIVEVTEPSLIIAINEFPIENPAAPIMSLEQVREAYAAQHAYDLQHPVKGDDNYYIIFTSGTTGKPKGSKFRMITCSASPTGLKRRTKNDVTWFVP